MSAASCRVRRGRRQLFAAALVTLCASAALAGCDLGSSIGAGSGGGSSESGVTLPAAQVVKVSVPPGVTTSTVSGEENTATSLPGGAMQFRAGIAGTITVSGSAWGVELHAVEPADGWTWTRTQNAPGTMVVRFVNGPRYVEMTFSTTVSGSISARLVESITTTTTSTTVPAPTTTTVLATTTTVRVPSGSTSTTAVTAPGSTTTTVDPSEEEPGGGETTTTAE